MTACLELFARSGLSGVALQEAVEERFPAGDCEAVKVSEYSPGPVEDHETLVRLVLHPIHVDERTGVVVSVAFTDVWKSDLSVFRDERASLEEIQFAVEQMKATGLRKTPPRERRVVEVRSARVAAVRYDMMPKAKARAFRVYDTGEKEKPHHASVFLTKAARIELSEKSVRKRLFELFGVVAGKYRDGLVVSSTD